MYSLVSFYLYSPGGICPCPSPSPSQQWSRPPFWTKRKDRNINWGSELLLRFNILLVPHGRPAEKEGGLSGCILSSEGCYRMLWPMKRTVSNASILQCSRFVTLYILIFFNMNLTRLLRSGNLLFKLPSFIYLLSHPTAFDRIVRHWKNAHMVYHYFSSLSTVARIK